MNNCAWCGIGIDSNEKFCSQYKGANVHYKDLSGSLLPLGNIGERIIEYTSMEFTERYTWEIPKDGILRRITIVTNKKLSHIRFTLNGSQILISTTPKSNEFVYTKNILLQEWADIRIDLETKFKERARIILETDFVRTGDRWKEQVKQLGL